MRFASFRRTSAGAPVVVLALALALGWPFAIGAETLPGANVEALLDYAREHNPELQARGYEAQAARERIDSVSALPDPKFQVEAMDFTNANAPGRSPSILPGQAGTTRYRAIQSLPFPGKRGVRGQVAEALADQADTQRRATRVELEARIKTAYARYFQAAGQARIVGETLTLVQAFEQLVLTRYGVGLVPQQDALRAQSEITALKVELVDINRRRQEAAAGLNALLPRDIAAPLAEPQVLPRLPAHLAQAGLIEQARDNSPVLVRERQGVTAADKSKELTYLNRYPDFTLALTNNRPRSGEDTWDLMLEVNIPLQQSARRAQEREVERSAEAARARVSSVDAQLGGLIGTSLAGLQASQEKARLLRATLLPQARATLDAAQAGYESGRVNFNTLIDAERQILNTRMGLLDAEVEASIRHAELEKLVGVPL